MGIFNYIKNKANQLLTGQRRTHGEGIRGRVFSKDNDDTNPGLMGRKVTPKATMTVRVKRNGQPDEVFQVDPANISINPQ